MAKHIVKCKYCGLQFDANIEPYVMVSARRYAHKACAEKHAAEQTQEERDEEQFYQYTKKIFGEDYNYITTRKLAKQYIKENGYSYSGMLKSLIWFYEIQNNSVDKANGSIGIIPYIYNKARDYYYSLYLAKLANEEKDIAKYIPKEKLIEIESPRVWVKPPHMFHLEDEDE